MTGGLDAFMVFAAIAGFGLSLAAGPLGCFILWRRMAYFGDAVAHAALLGVALALLTDLPVWPGVLLVALGVAIAIAARRSGTLSTDTLLGVAAHGGLALGLVAIGLAGSGTVDLHRFLFGEILAVDMFDLVLIWAGALGVVALLVWNWSGLVTVTLSEDLAAAAGVDTARVQQVFALSLAIIVAIGIKVVGALLISAMLILPAAAARMLARSPEGMAGLASLLAGAAVIGGLAMSLTIDSQAGPSIVVAALVILVGASLFRRRD